MYMCYFYKFCVLYFLCAIFTSYFCVIFFLRGKPRIVGRQAPRAWHWAAAAPRIGRVPGAVGGDGGGSQCWRIPLGVWRARVIIHVGSDLEWLCLTFVV